MKTIAIKLAQVFAISAVLAVPAHAALSEGDVEPYLKKQGCFKCHAIDKTKKGPSYKKIAEKLKAKPDPEGAIVKNLTTSPKVKLEDGTEEEHKEIETKDKADHKAIANWILTR
ncbi:c-type cytochrome [Noviherbaspirillum denitrificans]|uniref:Cytochrome C n=1 Tax=Noviherbaspirillum denitrificans TaxID=1968433 RepID=A0A254TJ68_9BURK|nr:c-type cytochrome [Noviherbaspirillum denitrificans]OWW22690.1 cytochrome C [Noviherbaspirillum denitrificans]